MLVSTVFPGNRSSRIQHLRAGKFADTQLVADKQAGVAKMYMQWWHIWWRLHSLCSRAGGSVFGARCLGGIYKSLYDCSDSLATNVTKAMRSISQLFLGPAVKQTDAMVVLAWETTVVTGTLRGSGRQVNQCAFFFVRDN
jgi:hypothetical protein